MPLEDALATLFDIDFLPRALSHNFTVVHAFNETFGKTANTMGNTAIIDCRFVKQIMQTTFDATINKIIDPNPFYFIFLKEIKKDVDRVIDEIDFCKYAMNVNGVLKDQIGVYGGTQKEQQRRLGEAGNQMI